MEPTAHEEEQEQWKAAVESVLTGVATPDSMKIDDSQIFDFKTVRPQGEPITVTQADIDDAMEQRRQAAQSLEFGLRYGAVRPSELRVPGSYTIRDGQARLRALRELYANMHHRDNTVEAGVFDSKMRERMHWFGSCQVAKYRIACTRADRYFDAGFISKRHMERLISRGRDPYYGNAAYNVHATENNERYAAHFRQLIQGLYNNHVPHLLNSAVWSCHWGLPRGDNCPIPIDEYYAVIYSSFWNEDIVWHKKWRNETIVGIADGIFKDKAWDRMPILADALEDAGCDNTAVLHRLRTEELIFPAMRINLVRGRPHAGHRVIRSPIRARGPHHRGCYILHRILGGRYNSRRIP